MLRNFIVLMCFIQLFNPLNSHPRPSQHPTQANMSIPSLTQLRDMTHWYHTRHSTKLHLLLHRSDQQHLSWLVIILKWINLLNLQKHQYFNWYWNIESFKINCIIFQKIEHFNNFTRHLRIIKYVSVSLCTKHVLILNMCMFNDCKKCIADMTELKNLTSSTPCIFIKWSIRAGCLYYECALQWTH